jgi:hypothetical protein
MGLPRRCPAGEAILAVACVYRAVMPDDAEEDELVRDVDAVLARHRATEPYALVFTGAIGRDAEGSFTFSTAGGCQSSDELFAYLSDPGALEHAARIAELLARRDVLALLRALVCERPPGAVDDALVGQLAELGVVELARAGSPRLTDRGFTLVLAFYSTARACRA